MLGCLCAFLIGIYRYIFSYLLIDVQLYLIFIYIVLSFWAGPHSSLFTLHFFSPFQSLPVPCASLAGNLPAMLQS